LTKHSFFRKKPGVVGLLSAAGTVATIASIAGLAGQLSWVLDLASHFRVQYFVTLVVVATALVATRSYRLAGLFSAMALLNLVLVLQLYMGTPSEPGSQGRPLSAMLINVHSSNTDHAAVLAGIKRHDPDFVLIQEVNQRWSEALNAIKDRYPHVVSKPREDNFGMVLLSKDAPLDSNILDVGNIGVPTILAKFALDGRAFFILGTHTLPPVGSEYARMRDRHLAEIPRVTAGLDAPVVVLGDLNTSPWSYHFRKLIRESGLRDASRGHGVQTTWPTHLFPMLIPIDHCLYSSGIKILDKEIGGRNGSDHYPVIVDFSLLGPQPD